MFIQSPDRDQLIDFITSNISDCAQLNTVDLILEEVKNGFTEVRVRGNRIITSKPATTQKSTTGVTQHVAPVVSDTDHFILTHERLCLVIKIARQVYNWVKNKWFS